MMEVRPEDLIRRPTRVTPAHARAAAWPTTAAQTPLPRLHAGGAAARARHTYTC